MRCFRRGSGVGPTGVPHPVQYGERVLHELLRSHGIDPGRPSSVGETWEVFKAFMAVPFETKGAASDGVLYQSGIFDFFGQDEFYLDFLRQFEVSDRNGEYDHYEHLHCEFRFAADDSTRAFGRFTHWWFPDDASQPWTDFIALVEHRPEFIALRSAVPQAVSIKQEPV